MGVTINKRKTTGVWYVWISHNGKRTSRAVGTDKQVALKAATQWRKKLALGEVDFSNGRSKDPDSWLFGEFFEDYIENTARHRLKYNTVTSYKRTARLYLLPHWKNRKLDSITRQDVKKLLSEQQRRGLFIGNIKICISAVFTEAMEQEILAVNPAHNLGRAFRCKKHKIHPRFLSKEQVATLLDHTENNEPCYCDFLLTAFRTGMRLGELVGLAWDSVNFDTRQIIVQRSYSHQHWDTPKSHKVRYIDTSDSLHKALLKRHEQRKPRLYCDSHTKKKICLVFPDENGEPMNDNIFRRGVFYKLLSQAGVPKIRIHDIRHTYASLLLQAGAPIHYVKDQLGHSSISITVDLYGHCQPGINRDAVNRLD